MYLKHVETGDLVEVIDLQDVVNPRSNTILVRGYGGDEVHRLEKMLKEELAFPSGESLPECWTLKNFYERIAIQRLERTELRRSIQRWTDGFRKLDRSNLPWKMVEGSSDRFIPNWGLIGFVEQSLAGSHSSWVLVWVATPCA